MDLHVKKKDKDYSKELADLPLEEQILELLEALEETEKKERAEEFMGFVNYVWPAFIEGRHHKIMADAFERVARGGIEAADNQHAAQTHEVRVCFVSPASMVPWQIPRKEDYPNGAYRRVVCRFWS